MNKEDLNIIIPFNMERLENGEELFVAIVTAIESKDDSVIYDTLDNLLIELSPYESALEFESLSNKISESYNDIKHITESLPKDSVIEEVIPLGISTLLKITQCDNI